VRVRVHKPGALRFAGSVGLVIDRRPGDFLASPQALNGTALIRQESGR
jgi:hypothetical protein